MIERITESVNADAALIRRGRYVSLSFLLGVGEHDYLVTIERGRIVSVEPRRLATMTGRFTIRASEATWTEFWKPVPRRDHHDLWAMLAAGLAKIDGDLLPLIQNLQYFKDALAAPRPPRKG
ncbi:MAG TPA: hypothetical protein VFO18_12765 [Methylomirabilota bacterium]|nr:hypothetical protein [Methylomirabilota bacterium]